MARQLHQTETSLSISQAGLAAVTLLFCGFAFFMCASHSRKWRHWGSCRRASICDPVIHLNPQAMMISTGAHGIRDPNNDELMFSGEQGVPVWQKNILMGEKCQLPDFSGVIIYDSDGNVIPAPKKPLPMLTWK